MEESVIEIKDISIDYVTKERTVHAVRDVTLELKRGEVLGIVGESGSGKSTLAMSFLNLISNPGKITKGNVIYKGYPGGKDVLKMKPSELRRYRWKEVSMIFQSSMNSLNPVMRIEDQIKDVMLEHGYDDSITDKKIDEILNIAGLVPSVRRQYPHELSGGMKQRVNIALALACDPKILIADEATTALDVVVQRQILTRLLRIKDQLSLSMVFITHDISLVANIADRVAVMYAGKIVEIAPVDEILQNTKHPYTIALLKSIPKIEKGVKLKGIRGVPPDLSLPIKGCPFADRCQNTFDRCKEIEPDLISIGSDHRVSCHLYGV